MTPGHPEGPLWIRAEKTQREYSPSLETGEKKDIQEFTRAKGGVNPPG